MLKNLRLRCYNRKFSQVQFSWTLPVYACMYKINHCETLVCERLATVLLATSLSPSLVCHTPYYTSPWLIWLFLWIHFTDWSWKKMKWHYTFPLKIPESTMKKNWWEWTYLRMCVYHALSYIYNIVLFNSLNVHRMLQPLTTSSNPIQSLLQLTACQLKKTVLLMTR